MEMTPSFTSGRLVGDDVQVPVLGGELRRYVDLERGTLRVVEQTQLLRDGTLVTGPGPDGAVAVRIDAPRLCPHYTARVIRGVTIRPSPAWMQRRLTAVGLRPINNVVDVTNYVLFEMGQPLHAFDYDKLAGRQIVVRTARPGERVRRRGRA